MLGFADYDSSRLNPNYINGIRDAGGFGGGLLMGYDFGLLAAQVEFLAAFEEIRLNSYSASDVTYSGLYFQVPIMLKLDFHFWRIMIQPQAGVYFNFGSELNQEVNGYNPSGLSNSNVQTERSLLGAMFGAALGFRIGKGYLFTDIRYATDFAATKVDGNRLWVRNAFLVNFGYQYYFGTRQ
jgi:hypothetical protein